MKTYKDALINLLKVKSLVTLLLTMAFIYQIVCGAITEEFMLIYTTVIAFYFGTQYEKKEQENKET